MAQTTKRALEGKLTFDTWQEGFLDIFRLAAENKHFVMDIYRALERFRRDRPADST